MSCNNNIGKQNLCIFCVWGRSSFARVFLSVFSTLTVSISLDACDFEKFFLYRLVLSLVIYCYLTQSLVVGTEGHSLSALFLVVWPCSLGVGPSQWFFSLSNSLGLEYVSALPQDERLFAPFSQIQWVVPCASSVMGFFSLPRGFCSMGKISEKNPGRTLCLSFRDALPLPQALYHHGHFLNPLLLTLVNYGVIQWGLWSKVWRWM